VVVMVMVVMVVVVVGRATIGCTRVYVHTRECTGACRTLVRIATTTNTATPTTINTTAITTHQTTSTPT